MDSGAKGHLVLRVVACLVEAAEVLSVERELVVDCELDATASQDVALAARQITTVAGRGIKQDVVVEDEPGAAEHFAVSCVDGIAGEALQVHFGTNKDEVDLGVDAGREA